MEQKKEVYYVKILRKFNRENGKESHKDPYKHFLLILISENDKEIPPLRV